MYSLTKKLQSLADPVQIGDWVVSASLHRLRRGEETVQLGPRLMQLLLRLAQTPKQVVTREELLDTVWGDVVVSEESLTVAVCELRRIFGDNQRSPRYIETIRHAGYRLVAEVRSPCDKELPVPEVLELGPSELEQIQPFAPARRAIPPGWVGAVIGVVVVAVLSHFLGRQLAEQNPPAEPVPLTSSVGMEIHPAISSNGDRVAYASGDARGGSLDIWVTHRNDETSLRLTSGPEEDDFPSWSRDGSSIAFARTRNGPAGPETSICVVPSRGGEVRQLASTPGQVSGLSWSPDGYSIAYSSPEAGGIRERVWILSLRSLGATPVPLDDEASDFGISPVFSPNSDRIAFVGGSEFLQDIYIFEIERGLLWRVAVDQREIAGLAWTEDGREIVFSSHPTGSFQLWRVGAYDSGIGMPEPTDIERLPVASMMATHPSISRERGVLVYQEMQVDSDVWRIEVNVERGKLVASEAVIASTRIDSEAEFSSTGEEIVFISARTGHREVWICDKNGQNPRRITDFGGSFVTWPRWLSNGETIVFSIVEAGRRRRRLSVPAEGGDAKPYHPRGRYSNGWRLGGHPSGDDVIERLDGSGIWLVAREEHRERLLVPKEESGGWDLSAASATGVFLLLERESEPLIRYFDYASEKVTTLGRLSEWRNGSCANLTASLDSRYLLVDRTYPRGGSDLMVVDGFQ
jgi:Tol biopolymer transport system component/DNA-binding winged helix-turn-helix (wHTH) protein